MKMQTSRQISNFFIQASQNSGQPLTPVKLIKLCYIAHGWRLAYTGQQLLDEVIYAWKYGPVIDTVYKDFKHYRNSQITELYRNPVTGEYPLPDEALIPFLEAIWHAYGKYTGIQLSAMTHQPNTPWDITWNQQGGKSPNYAIIPNDLIKTHYQKKLAQAHAQPAASS